MPTVYLAGPINGCTDDEARGWRYAVRASLPLEWSVLDPMVRDYRGRERGNEREIVDADRADIAAADVVLVNASRPAWGTAMEIVEAWHMGKRIVAFGAPSTPSPWLVCYCGVLVPSFDAAVRVLVEGA